MLKKNMRLLLKDYITFSALECLPKEAYIPAGAYSSTKICVCVGMHTYLYDFFICSKRKRTLNSMKLPLFFISHPSVSIFSRTILITGCRIPL